MQLSALQTMLLVVEARVSFHLFDRLSSAFWLMSLNVAKDYSECNHIFYCFNALMAIMHRCASMAARLGSTSV
jgi:hypothetical protein